jgi:hypothetical protein
MKSKLLIISILFLSSCKFTNNDKLNETDIDYIKSLGLLNDNEKIIWFDSQFTKRVSGNFLSDKRLASYWIDQHNESKSFKKTAHFSTIDSLKLRDLTINPSYSSYIEVYSKKGNFKVYISQDSLTINEYYREANISINKHSR